MKILVLGDVCTDIFIYGKCKRLCPEAPVPVFVPSFTKENSGMAGNLLENLKVFTPFCDFLVNDQKITKTRYVDQKTNALLLRVDEGDSSVERIDPDRLKKIKYYEYKAVVIADYGKGFLTEEDIEYISLCHSLVFVDTKKNMGDWASNVKYFKINEIEYLNLLQTSGEYLYQHKEKFIITLGDKGCRYQDIDYPVQKVEVRDLSGAGDTFLAALVYSYLIRESIIEAIKFANKCASSVVQHKGVVPITKEFIGFV